MNAGIYIRSGPSRMPRRCPDHPAGAVLSSEEYGSGCLECGTPLRRVPVSRVHRADLTELITVAVLATIFVAFLVLVSMMGEIPS